MDRMKKAKQMFEEALEAAEGVMDMDEVAGLIVEHIDGLPPARREAVLSRGATRALYESYKQNHTE